MKCDKLTPIELECNMGIDSVTGLVNREPWKAYDIDEVDAAIVELKDKLHDAEMRERRMKRALWLARAERAKEKQQLFHFSLNYQTLTIEGFYDPYKGCRMLSPKKWIKIFNNIEIKCRAKADKFKEGV